MSGGLSTGGEHRFANGARIDRYEIREAIGRGGMGAVYRAFDTKLGRMVALKTVIGQRRGTLSEEVKQRFMREALAVSKVDHRNVVRVLDFGFTEDGWPFIVMEYLRGKDLGARLRDNGGPLPVELVVDVMLGVCAALRACHQAGIIHRDLKPANIFLAEADTGYEVKVLDFGVSKAPLAGDLTEDGQILGTPQYLSPEQVAGRTVPESDQYALGMLLYACLTKRLPYEEHNNLSLLRAIELGKFPPPRVHRSELPAELEEIILQAMRPTPAERFPSVHALGQRLWPFASPAGREHWRSYFQAAPPPKLKDSTLGEAVLAQLARGALKGPGPEPARVLAPTEPLTPPADEEVATPPPLRRGGQSMLSTKLASPGPGAGLPSSAVSAEGSLLDVAGESAIRNATGGSGRTLRRAVVLLLGVGAVGGGAFVVHSRVDLVRNPRTGSEPPATGSLGPSPSSPNANPLPGVAEQAPSALAIPVAPALPTAPGRPNIPAEPDLDSERPTVAPTRQVVEEAPTPAAPAFPPPAVTAPLPSPSPRLGPGLRHANYHNEDPAHVRPGATRSWARFSKNRSPETPTATSPATSPAPERPSAPRGADGVPIMP